MIQFKPEGIYCPQADVYIDLWRPVNKAIITHGHSDHARPGHKEYLCHTLSKEILKLRLGQQGKLFVYLAFINLEMFLYFLRLADLLVFLYQNFQKRVSIM